jgi:hypothetical protein
MKTYLFKHYFSFDNLRGVTEMIAKVDEIQYIPDI